MNWQQWVVVGFLALSALTSILTIGKPKKPLTPGIAAAAVIVDVALIALVVTA